MVGSHNRTVRSPLTVASIRPSDLNATPYTGPVWPSRGSPTGLPVAGSHNRTVSSKLAVASSRPSGLNATPHSVAVAFEGFPDRVAGGRVPQSDCLVSAGRGHQLAVRAERDPVHPVGVAFEGLPDRVAGGRVPQSDCLVSAGRG